MSYPEDQKHRGLIDVILVMGLILMVLVWSFSIL